MKNVESKPLEWLIEPLHPLGIWLKLTIILIVSSLISSYPTHPSWAVSMILIAVLILVPIGFQQFMLRLASFKRLFISFKTVYAVHLLSAILLSISFTINQGAGAALLALPYAFWCAFIFIKTIKISFKMPQIGLMATWGFLTNAAFWCVADRLNFQPWGFSAWIILLTGVHFHYAGFALMATLALFLNENPNDILFKNATRAVLLGVVLTAIGITTTQLGFPILIETLAGVVMALAAFGVGIAVILRGWRELPPTRTLWLCGGFCLSCGMVLALGYALRHFIVIDWLSIPNMQAVHGTLNALGFGSLMLIGWHFKRAN